MPLQLYVSNDLKELAEKIILTEQDPFQKSIFITQTEGIKHWLSLYLADKEGVFSNFRFYKPNEFINDVAYMLMAGKPSLFNPENIRWMIYHILNEDEFKNQFGWVAKYYAKDELRRIQLACKVSDLFDQYIVYRTEMMENWSDHSYMPEEREKWQCELWRKIKAMVEKENKDAIDKAQFKRIIQQKLQTAENGDKLKEKFPVVHVFGLSVMTRYHLDIYNAFSDYIDLRFYLLNPSPDEYWYDIVSDKELARKWAKKNTRKEIEEMSTGNALLSEWGMVGKELFLELFDADDRFINAFSSYYVEKPATDLLSVIQDDIHNNRNAADQPSLPKEFLQDGSIQIASNYSISREVEVLYDYLLDKIDKEYKGKDIEPQDIVVMVPNIQDYIPYIKTVFGNAPVALPYSIGDEPVQNAYAITNLIIAILGVSEQEFTSENVLKFLDYETVLKHFRINDVPALRQAVRNCNVRFGIDGDHKTETDLVSWSAGLERMIMGIAMRDEVFVDGDKTVDPYLNAEGDFVEDVLSFVQFVDKLKRVVKASRGSRTLSKWADYVRYIISEFVEETRDNEDEFTSLEQQLVNFSESNEMFGEMELDFKVFNYIFKDFHLNELKKDGYFRGRITFCTALPMRSIPFKIIAFLGLNSESFPRKSSVQGFDLIQNGPRQRGDRNIKDNDRYLFLEAFLSAKDNLYLSYNGRSLKDNSEKNASVLIEELLDYASKRTGVDLDEVKAMMVKEYPLQAYSDKYLQSSSGLKTYFPMKIKEGKQLSTMKEIREDSDDLHMVDLQDLKRFVVHPLRWYFQKELGIYYNDDDSSVDEYELFGIERGLHAHSIKNDLINIAEEDLPKYIQSQKRKGGLPLGNMGLVLTEDEYYGSVKNIQTKWFDIIDEAETQVVDCEISIDSIALRASKLMLYDKQRVDYCFSKAKRHVKYLLPLYIDYLMLKACGYECDSVLLCEEVDYRIENKALSAEDAKEKLADLLGLFVENHKKQIPFLPEFSDEVLSKSAKDKEIDLEKVMVGDSNYPGYAIYDPYVGVSYFYGDVWKTDFEDIAKRILTPMKELLE